MRTEGVDYYALLGVSETASQKEIRTAYRRLALRYHPDRNADPRAAELFNRFAEAYRVVGNAERRTGGDRFPARAETPGHRERPPNAAHEYPRRQARRAASWGRARAARIHLMQSLLFLWVAVVLFLGLVAERRSAPEVFRIDRDGSMRRLAVE